MTIYVARRQLLTDNIDLDAMRAFYKKRNIEVTIVEKVGDLNLAPSEVRRRDASSRTRRQRAAAKTTAPRVAKPKQDPTRKVCRECSTDQPKSAFPVSPRGRVLWVCATCIGALSGDVRTCRTCGQEKPLSRFERSRASIGGRTRVCSTCRNVGKNRKTQQSDN